MKNIKGFTLVEVLATILILGILLMVAVPSVSKLQESTNIKQIVADANVFVELVKQKIESDTDYSGTSHKIELGDNVIDKTKLSSNKYKSDSYVEANGCSFVNDIFKCTSFKVKLENDNYKAEGTVTESSNTIVGARK